MKRIVLLILTIASLSLSLTAQIAFVDSLFSHSNTAYGKQDYELALEGYQQIADTGYVSAELFLNMGNAYFKLGDNARAILYYEKALLLNPSDEDILFNLQKAQAFNIDRIDEIPELFFVVWFKKLILVFSSNTWASVALTFLLLGLTFLFVYFIAASRNKKITSFTFGVVFLLSALLSYTFSVKTRNYVVDSKQAIVITPTVTIKGSPDPESANLFIIHEGTKVFLIREIGEWNEIRIADGKQGWLPKSVIEEI
jgi:tetratricopeptide (TPR) repeat protein